MELRSNCGVNTRMIQKLSQRQSTLETRMKILTEIAAENGVVLKLDDSSPAKGDEGSRKSVPDAEIDELLSFSESRNGKKKYKDVEDAAQAAFELAAAAYAAAVELSRSRSFGSDNLYSPNSRPRKMLDSDKSKLRFENEKTEDSESEPEKQGETSKNNAVSGDGGGSDSDEYVPLEKMMFFDESEGEIGEISTSKEGGFDDYGKTESGIEEELKMQQLDLSKRPISVRTRRVYVR